ncbi:MAG TPA: hypothetical protein VNL98_00105 [Gemmatimonadales bacterium]|nr:hypothetical protein [Gemmatimonadales bacterium]
MTPRICMADMEDGGNRSREVLDTARDAGSQREADAEAGATARLLEALEVVRLELGETPARPNCSRLSGPGRGGSGSRAPVAWRAS